MSGLNLTWRVSIKGQRYQNSDQACEAVPQEEVRTQSQVLIGRTENGAEVDNVAKSLRSIVWTVTRNCCADGLLTGSNFPQTGGDR